MILKGSQRSGARALADHLMNDRDNDHVTVINLDGFMADDLKGAFLEVEAISKGTRCKQYLFSLSLNPPSEHMAGEQDFKDAADRIGDVLGLSDQPRAIVLHEKQGRRHAHVVWSRIDVDEMKAINLPHFKNKLRDMSRELFLDHGWELPQGLRTYGKGNPLNFTLEEWQQARRQGIDPREIKQVVQEAWQRSDDRTSLQHALRDRGLFLARGDRRGAVVLDIDGNPYALARWAGVKAKDVKGRLGDFSDLPSVDETLRDLSRMKTDQVRDYIQSVQSKHRNEVKPLNEERLELRDQHRAERVAIKAKQEERSKAETKTRQDRLNKGLRGLFDRLTGKASDIRRENETDAWRAMKRDQAQRDDLVLAQMRDRKNLQERFEALKRRQKNERQILTRNLRDYLHRQANEQHRDQERNRERTRGRGPSLGR